MKRFLIFSSLGAVLFFFGSCSTRMGKKYKTWSLNDGWLIRSADSVSAGGAVISKPGFDTGQWYATGVPATVLHCLAENGIYSDVFRDDNLEKISPEPFRCPWWYRTTFQLNDKPEGLLLKFDGVNYKANIWLNGKKIADTTEVVNSFRHFTIDITPYVEKGENVLAVEVVPPRPGDFTVGFVDWNPMAPDRDMGLFRPVYLEKNGGVAVSDLFIVTSLNDDLSRAVLTASAVVTNYSAKKVSGEAVLTFEGQQMPVPVTLVPGARKKVLFKAADFKALTVVNPDLWWPHTLGDPHLYRASFAFRKRNEVSDKKELDFGIRTVSSYMTPEGYRAFRVNGKKIQIHGAGWTDRMMLDNTDEDLQAQLNYVKDVNLNAIRMEGFWGNSRRIYDLCDRMGILVMVGWSCHWEWAHLLGKHTDNKYGGILSEEDMAMMSEAWKDQIVWLRNHPSIFAWFGGSDLEPKPELEKKYFNILEEYDSSRVYLASAKSTTTLAGPSGVKMEGPYAYVPPVYWFSDSVKGGAFGFATEIGPGAQVPPAESIKKMLSKEHWWPMDEMWNFHCGRGRFATLDRFTKALDKRYGTVTGFDDFERKAQVLNYELMRPMFEAYSSGRYKATGLILWMLNSAWPEMYWQLYDYYLMPNAAYYGAKTALRPYHVVYDYYREGLYAVNDRLEDKNNCRLKVRVYDVHSNLKYEKEIPVNLKANSSHRVLSLKVLEIPSVYFIDTRLFDSNGDEIDNNFYWISPKKDILDYEDKSTPSYVHTASGQYADFTDINKMPIVKVKSTMSVRKGKGTTNFEVMLKNGDDKIAFFLHVAVVDNKTGETILPVLWSDNYVSLLPGESRSLKARIENSKLKGRDVKLVMDGYNLKK